MGSGNELQRQKKGPGSLGGREGQRKCTQGKGVGKGANVLPRESHTGSFFLRVFIWKSQRRIPVEYSSAFQVCPFRVKVSTDWSGRVHQSMQLVLITAMVLYVWLCRFSGPGAETQLRPRCIRPVSESYCLWGLLLKSYSLPPLICCTSKGGGLTYLTSSMPGEERPGEGTSHQTRVMKGQGV